MSDESAAPDAGSTHDVVTTVRELIDLMAAGGISELDVATGDLSIRLRTPTVAAGTMPMAVMTPSVPASEPPAQPAGHVITSPMIGTFYAAPAPGEPDFVAVGDHVEAGQVIGIVEAMKIMNEIVADKSGTIVEMLVANAQPVEFGSPLARMSLEGLSPA